MTIGYIALPFLLTGLAVAQSTDAPSWARVQSLTPGTHIDVAGTGGRKDRASGKLLSTAADSLTIQTSSGPRTFQLAGTRSVELPNPRRKLWIGLGAAAAVGAAFATTFATQETVQFCNGRNCATFPKERSAANHALTTGVTLGAAIPFVWLSRSKVLFKAN